MPCYHPLTAWRSREKGKKGTLGVTFKIREGFSDLPVSLPCGQCVGCRLERSRQWAIRCVHESSLHSENCFLTLTYDSAHLPPDGSLSLDTFQKFMKRLRKHFVPSPVRFFHCGEYGGKLDRPHYHVLLFGVDFIDKKPYNNGKLCISETLAKLWPFGFHTIGDVTFDSAAYVARYCLKKVTGDEAEAHYETTDFVTGELTQRSKEYVTMSRRPGIGSMWYDKYSSETYRDDSVVMRGRSMRPPRFYDKRFELEDSDAMGRVRLARRAKLSFDSSDARLAVQEEVASSKLSLSKRSFEND
ncbi:MAG: replication initiator protein [Microvirus sp.]|nr:MAG: replication initiator protein [Microvirus sp.]